MNAKLPTAAGTGEPERAEWVDVVVRKVEALRFGSVQITVHDGRVTQVESLERTRFSNTLATNKPGS